MRTARLIALFCAASLSACAEFPELDAQITSEMRRADYPSLISTQSLQGPPAPLITPQSQGALSARVAALKARAARLRGSVVSPATKRRLRAPITIAGS